MSYAGGAPATTVMTQVPDYPDSGEGAGANDTQYFNLIQGMCKWKTDDTEIDGPSHTLTAIELAPTPTATLTSIKVAKAGGTYVVFWGATGIATKPCDGRRRGQRWRPGHWTGASTVGRARPPAARVAGRRARAGPAARRRRARPARPAARAPQGTGAAGTGGSTTGAAGTAARQA